MGAFFVYILKSAFCVAMFYLFYRLLLSKETFHRFNRFALLGLMCLSGLLPLVRVTVGQAEGTGSVSMPMDEWGEMEQWSVMSVADEAPDENLLWKQALLLVYAGGVLFFFLRSLWSVGRLLYFIRRSCHRRWEQGIWLIVHEEAFSPFSWMKYIVISRHDLEENGRDILLHETAHIRKHHSWDLLFAEVCVWLQWFNPAVWLLKQELQNVHEYEADEEVLRKGIDAKHYQMLLIKKAVGTRLYTVANSFTHSSLKKRITMMIRKKSSSWARAKSLYVLPLATVAVAAFARPEISRPLEEISSVEMNDFSEIMKNQANVTSNVSSESTIKVEGTVVDDETGSPMPGVSVIIRGTTNGTLTDLDGKFVLEAPDNSVIVLSYIGKQSYSFIASEKDLKSLKVTPVRMKDEIINTDEIVVVGYAPEEEQTSQKAEKVNQAKEDKEELVFIVVEEMPEFPGGMGEMMKYLARNIKYPVEAQKARIEGRVIVQFVVKADGSTSDFVVKRSVSPSLDAEAIRVLSGMPKWKPGKQRGKAVDVKFTVPVTFRLQKKESNPPLKLEVDEPAGNTASASAKGQQESDDRVFMVVEEMPEYPGGMSECLKFLSENVKYPENKMKEGVQGRVIVQVVIKADGSVSNPQVLRSVDPELDAEAVRVMMSMPKWKPGRQRGQAVDVKFTLPVTFRLDKADEAEQEVKVVGGKETSSLNIRSLVAPDKAPLVFIDGVEVSADEMERLSPEKIKNISVLKNPSETNRYGEKGKNGVILIVTKKK